MEKRLFLAIALALLILLSWSAFVSKTQHIDNKAVVSKEPLKASLAPTQTTIIPTKTQEPPPVSLFKFSQKEFDILFIESQAAIKEVVFKSYQNYAFPLKYGFLTGDPGLIFQKRSVTDKEIDFVYRDKNKEIIKRFIFSKSKYNIELEVNVQNLTNVQFNMDLPLILGVLNLNGDQAQAQLRDATFVNQDKIMHFNLRKDVTLGDIKFIGLRDHYFCAIVEPALKNYTGFVKKLDAKESEIGLTAKEFALGPNQQIQLKFNIYLGPQELQQISSIKPQWTAIMYYGTFDFIAHLLLQLLDFIFGLVHNWGLAIVMLSVLIYLILYPLTLKQMRSMKQMQALQPRIEELRKLYKDNPQKMNTQIMSLYKEYKVNPLSGCLPLVLQMPIFFALYQVLIRSVAFKGAKFLWIKDLAMPDRLFILPVSIPFLGNEVNLLPILMTIGMFVQQKISMASAGTGSAEQQKLMMILFPLIFGFIFYHMPSGLVLYWFVNSGLMLFYQIRINRQK